MRTPSPTPTLTVPQFQGRALCAQTDPETFFPAKGGSSAAAKRVCSSCDIQAACLAWALSTGERHGIWGGLSDTERRRLTRAAGQSQRPPSAPAAARTAA
jgi:WhiB family redox-sensing transcriptional regulator